MAPRLSDYAKTQRAIQRYHEDLRKENKVPGSIVPSSKTLKAHDVFTERMIRDLKHDPVKELVDLAQHPDDSIRMRELKAQINMELLQYMIPKLKAVDTNPNQGETISISVVMPGAIAPEQVNVIRPGSLPPISNVFLEDDNDER